jgi:glycosyltransferase involved in cell wall biosynthesis
LAHVSVICIFLDAELYFDEAIRSVRRQTYQNFELLLVDDGSRDRTTELALTHAAADPDRIRYLAHPGRVNRGMSAARNLGLAHATGDLVAFIDADDRWRPAKLAEQVAIMAAQPAIGMLAGTVNYWRSWTGGTDVLTPTGHRQDEVVDPPQAALASYPVGRAAAACPSDVMIRRSVLEQVGGFEDTFTGSFEDIAVFGKIFVTAPVWFSGNVWLDYRIHPDSSVSGMIAGGLYPARRRRFLQWYRDWLRQRGDAAEVLRAVQQRLWRDRLRPATYRHTPLGRLAGSLRAALR